MNRRTIASTLAITMIIVLSVFALTACADTDPSIEMPVNGSQTDNNPDTGNDTDDITEPEENNDNSADETDTQNDPDEPEPEQTNVFAFRAGDFLIEMNRDITDVLNNLGEPSGIFERPSCAFDGMDIIYGYPDIEIFTYPVGDKNHVHTVNFINDSPRTTEGGIRMGASLQDVFDAYGTEYTYDTGMYTYTRGLTILQFYVENDIVWGITYGFIIE